MNRTKIESVGAAIGRSAPTAYFTRGGPAQKLVDQDFQGSERITGCDLYSFNLTNNTTSANAFAAGAYYENITCSTISSRVQAIEEMYQWNAIRSLKLHYSPVVGTGTPNSIAIGISTDAEITSLITAPTQQQVMEFQPSMLSPVWGFASCELKMRGTKLFESYNSSESKDTRIQAVIAAVYNSSVAALITTGQLWVEYVIDFYQQTPLLSSVDLFRSGRPCPRCKQIVSIDPTARAKLLTGPHKGQNSQAREERKTPSAAEPDSPVLVSGLSTPGRQEDHPGQPVAAVRSAHGARSSSTKGAY